METTVNLQRLLRYTWRPITIVGALLALATLILICMIFIKINKNKKKHKKNTIREIMWTAPHLERLKQEYLAKLLSVEEDFNRHPDDIRGAYERMSALVREFAYKATGVEVDKYTLTEIRFTDMKGLADIVEEYYEPEFDKISEGDVKSSIEKTRRLILGWN
jgi:hypothetical protein